MPKRGGRGGRGRGRGRGCGGSSGAGGRGGFYKKRGGTRGGGARGGRGSGAAPSGFREDVMMLDMDGEPNVYTPPVTSMKAAARRTRRPRMQDEAFSTDANRDEMLKLPLRQRPLEFIKSDSYDPTKDLIKGLQEKEQERVKPGDELDGKIDANAHGDLNYLAVDATSEMKLGEAEQGPIGDEGEDVEDDDDLEEVNHLEEDTTLPPKKEQKSKKMSDIPDSQLFFVDDTLKAPAHVKMVHLEESKIQQPYRVGPNTEFDPTFSIGKVHLHTTHNDIGETYTTLPRGKGSKAQKLKDFNPGRFAELETPEFDDLEEQVLAEDNPELYKSYQTYINRVMGNLFDQSSDEEDVEENNTEHDQEIYDELGDDFEEEANFIAGLGDDDEDGDDVLHDITTEDQATTTFGKLSIEEEVDDEPEYGFLEEDYETFDNSMVEVINIRYGSASNQYHMKSFRLTGTYEHQWVDQDLFTDFLLENGMPEHRLNAYFRYIKNLLTPPEEEEKNYDDIPISDSSEEEDFERDDYHDSDGQLGDSDMEGLDDLIQYTKKYDGQRDMDVEPTRTLKTKGKGKKRELDLEGVSSDLADRLYEQWQLSRDGKKERKRRREETIAREHAKSQDLLLKYPYTLHVKDIRNEFEEFLNDSKRNALTFPPLDPHGIKVVQKFANLYNMKSRKFGKGLTSHAVAVKNKRTFRSLPDYHSIAMLMKQRPVFNRIDQKRPRSEVENEKSSRRGNPSKAHVNEGDIVGANAPEIAGDNVGRRLLLKMGWKSGQGLGLDNRGIPEPVVAKVKKTKTGIR